jgi:hypothetical protein
VPGDRRVAGKIEVDTGLHGGAALNRYAQPAAFSVPLTATPAPAARALTTRFADFWLLGGASVLVWAVMWALEDYRTLWAVDSHFKNLAVTTVSLSLLVNHPHFLISYKLAYSRGLGYVRAHWWQLAAVPALLLVLLAVAYVAFTAPSAVLVPFMPAVARLLEGWGASTAALTTPQLGDLLFTLLFNLMFFTVGWHYTKQAFGCMMLYAHFDGYALSPRQRGLLKWNLLGVGGLNLAYGSRTSGALSFSHYSYYSVDVPDVLFPLSVCFLAATGALVFWKVFYRNYVGGGQVPSVNMLVPFVAMYVWWMPFTRQHEFYFLLVPLFHSLQYLAVAGKLEHARLRGSARYEVRAAAIAIALVAAGWLSFEFVPSTLDKWLATFEAWRIFFFFTAAMLFINIHHYFIDNVIWRFKDPEIRAYLLG